MAIGLLLAVAGVEADEGLFGGLGEGECAEGLPRLLFGGAELVGDFAFADDHPKPDGGSA